MNQTHIKKTDDIYVPHEAEIVNITRESETIFTFQLKYINKEFHQKFSFIPGQFNMLYLFGVGEVAISISSDPDNKETYGHTIRSVGRVTNALTKLQVGDCIGIRGPYGNGWPLEKAQQQDVIIITGGLGCAPVVSVIHYIMERRDQFGKLRILQGVKHSNDLIYRSHYEQWRKLTDTEVYIAADHAGPQWPWIVGPVTNMIQSLTIEEKNTICMMCGPEIMMEVAAKELIKKQVSADRIYLSMERNMECAIGHCGHCQFGGYFICKDGPIFAYNKVKNLLMCPGF